MNAPKCAKCDTPLRRGVLFVTTSQQGCEPLEWSDGDSWAVRADPSHRSLVTAFRCPQCGEVRLFDEAPLTEQAEGQRFPEVACVDDPDPSIPSRH